MRVSRMVCRARFRRRSPPRLRRWRVVLPLEAGRGLVPAMAAKAASEWMRPGWDHTVGKVAAFTAPTPGALVMWALSEAATRSVGSRLLLARVLSQAVMRRA